VCLHGRGLILCLESHNRDQRDTSNPSWYSTQPPKEGRRSPLEDPRVWSTYDSPLLISRKQDIPAKIQMGHVGAYLQEIIRCSWTCLYKTSELRFLALISRKTKMPCFRGTYRTSNLVQYMREAPRAFGTTRPWHLDLVSYFSGVPQAPAILRV
jgi:hypothetical protein